MYGVEIVWRGIDYQYIFAVKIRHRFLEHESKAYAGICKRCNSAEAEHQMFKSLTNPLLPFLNNCNIIPSVGISAWFAVVYLHLCPWFLFISFLSINPIYVRRWSLMCIEPNLLAESPSLLVPVDVPNPMTIQTLQLGSHGSQEMHNSDDLHLPKSGW